MIAFLKGNFKLGRECAAISFHYVDDTSRVTSLQVSFTVECRNKKILMKSSIAEFIGFINKL